jgi:nucleotide-binding universal stress UspA family protein
MAPQRGHVICYLDDAVDPRPALDVAEDLAARLGHEVLLASSAPRDAAESGFPHSVRQALEGVNGAVKRIERIEPGRTDERLAALVEEERARLVVVSAGSHSAPLARLLGRPHLTLAAVGPCPVVVVPEHLREQDRRSGPIVGGVDGSDESLAAIRVAAKLSGALDTPLVVVAVASVPVAGGVPCAAAHHAALLRSEMRSSRRLLERALSELPAGLDTDLEIELGDPAEQLIDVAMSCAAGLLVVGARGVGGARQTALGSVSADLAAWAPVPVVIVPAPSRKRTHSLFAVVSIAVPAAEPGLVPLALGRGEAAMVLLALGFVLVLVVLVVLELLGRLGEGGEEE